MWLFHLGFQIRHEMLLIALENQQIITHTLVWACIWAAQRQFISNNMFSLKNVWYHHGYEQYFL